FLQADQFTRYSLVRTGSQLKRLDRVRAGGGRKDLNVEPMGDFKDEAPDLRLHGVVDTILDLVHEEHAVLRIDQGKHNTQHAVDAVAHASQGNRPVEIVRSYDGDAFIATHW